MELSLEVMVHQELLEHLVQAVLRELLEHQELLGHPD
jgi:hypothetical protein